MKPSPKVDLIKDGSNTPIGTLLHADYTAEHEWGVDSLYWRLGIPNTPSVTGIERRSTPRPVASDKFVFAEGRMVETFLIDDVKKRRTSRYAALTTGFDLDLSVDRIRRLTYPRQSPDQDVIGSWSENAFLVVGFTDDARRMVKDLADGLSKGDFALWSGRFNDNPFDRGGLVLVRPSRVSAEHKKTMKDNDAEILRLDAAAEATGIRERILASHRNGGTGFKGPAFHVLKPAWAGTVRETVDGRVLDTSHPVIFFLNPHNQDAYNFGWFTVEELDAWLDGHGPVLKDQSKPAPAP